MLTTRLTVLGALAAATLAGCGGPTTRHHPYYAEYGVAWQQPSGGEAWRTVVPVAPEAPPPLGLGQEDVDAALATQASRRQAQARTCEARLARTQPAALDLSLAAAGVREAWGLAQRERADALVGAHPALLDLGEAQASGALTLACEYVQTGRGGRLQLTLERGTADGAVAVCVPPGTYGAPLSPAALAADLVEVESGAGDWTRPRDERRYRHWPSPQDLALLEAQVVVLGEGQVRTQVTLPVACASFEKRGPTHGQPYRLERFANGSAPDRLLVALCAGEVEASESEIQLAVWLARNDVRWEQFLAEGGHYGRLVTFGSAHPVLPEHAVGAARLLLDSGVDPRGCAFFGGQGGALAPEAPAADAGQAGPAADEPAPSEPAPAAPASPPGDTLEG